MYVIYEPVLLLFVNRFLSFLYVSMDDVVEPFCRDDVEFSAEDVFDSDDDELSEPDDEDFDINDLVPADDDDEDDADEEYAVLFELNQSKKILMNVKKNNEKNLVLNSRFDFLPGRLIIGTRCV